VPEVYVNKHECQSENITEFWTTLVTSELGNFITGIRHTVEAVRKQITSEL
jgi:hypothetical protein